MLSRYLRELLKHMVTEATLYTNVEEWSAPTMNLVMAIMVSLATLYTLYNLNYMLAKPGIACLAKK